MPASEGKSGTGAIRVRNRTAIFATVLLIVFTVVPILLGLFIAPWFFLIMLALIVVPLLFIINAPVN